MSLGNRRGLGNLSLVKARVTTPGDRKSLKYALEEIASIDCDFNGENGDEYLSDEAKAKGYKTNFDYAFDTCAELNENDEKLVEEFFKEWLDFNCYWENYSYIIEKDADGDIAEIILAALGDS